jgi:DHA2 family multidrug resistance protein-like MFS transporter
MGLGLGALGLVGADTPYVLIGAVFVATGAVEGVVYALSTTMVLQAAPEEKSGAAGAVSETAYELGTALGIALIGAALTAVYRAGLPAGGRAADSLGDALAVAATQPPAQGAALATTAKGSFVHAMHAASLLSAALLLTAALAVHLLLRRQARP